MLRRSRAGVASVALLAAVAGCRTLVAIQQDSLDLIGVASSNFVPASYGNLVGKFIETLKKAPPQDEILGSATADSDSDSAKDSSPSAATPAAPAPPPAASVHAGTIPVVATSQPAAASPRAEPLEVEFDVVKQVVLEGSSIAVPVRDTDVLRDGDPADPMSGDNYQILFRSSRPCHVYIVQVDGVGQIYTHFPGGPSGLENPVVPNREYTLPSNGDWYFLDENKGVETIYFFASREPHLELEKLLREIEAARPATPPPVRIDRPLLVTRGVGGSRPGKDRQVQLSSGQTSSVSPTAFLVPARTAELVLTRSFRHE